MTILKIFRYIVLTFLLCGLNVSPLLDETRGFELRRLSNFHGSNVLLVATWTTNSHFISIQPYSHKKFLKRRIIYARNGTATFNPELLVLSLSGDVHPNPGPTTPQTDIAKSGKNKQPNNNDNTYSHPTLCSDLPSGLRITQWNLRSLAPIINNTKPDEIKLILRNPGSETHILGVIRNLG